MKLVEIASRLGCRLEGDAQIEISAVAGIEEAGPGQLTFLSNPKYRSAVKTTKASAILAGDKVGPLPIAVLRSANPYLDFARAIELFYQPPRYAPGIHPTAVVAPSAKIGPGAHIGPYCFLDDDVHIGANAVLHSFVSIYRGARIGGDFFAHSHTVVREHCRIGNRVILQNGVVIGGDGFGFAKQDDGRWYKMLQAGVTVLEDDVEVQSNTSIDRATVGETRLRRGAKIDDLVLVGHASKVGENSLLCGQVGLAGSTEIGNNCILAGQVGSAGHLFVGDGAVITAQSGVGEDLPPNSIWSGSPVMENRRWLKVTALLKQLPELHKTVRELKDELARFRPGTASA